MNATENTFGLTCRDPRIAPPVLAGVSAEARLDGVLFELTLRQTYRNAGDRVLEVVYTFPLPQQAVLLGFASELDGARQVGTIVARKVAERTYEKALAEGDAPVMLEAWQGGLHTANIGNLKPGDEIVLEVRFAQLLSFEQGRLRLAIPATIAPRYGNAGQAGLQPQQVPDASPMVEYPLSLAVSVAGALARADVDCPTHRFTRQPVDGGQRLVLDAGAWMDRDVIVTVQPKEPLPCLVVQCPDTVPGAAPTVVMASLQPPPSPRRESITLKLLVDCSGSMGGDSIKSARTALHGVLAELGPRDHVSLTRFGFTVDHVTHPVPVTQQQIEHLQWAVGAIDANLGGTEMEAALAAVIGLPCPAGVTAADVLLLTDGQIWQAQPMIDAARRSGHRVFAIGVGSSPAEGVLRSLAEATGGACEFATPGESLQAAVRRMLARIRQVPWRNPRIDWGAEPAWQTALPASIFSGDTVVVLAGLAGPVDNTAVRLMLGAPQGELEIARGQASAPCAGDVLPRIAAARRACAADPALALELAVAYQLLGQHTHCILVHERAQADKATDTAELHRVSSMMAAGWGATSTIVDFDPLSFDLSTPSVSRSRASRAARAPLDSLFASVQPPADDLGVAPPRRVEPTAPKPASLLAISLAVVEHLTHGGEVSGLEAHCESLLLHADAQFALAQVMPLGASRSVAWLLLAHWTNRRQGGMGSAEVADVLRLHVAAIDAGLVQAAMNEFDGLIGSHPIDRWKPSRRERLDQAMTSRHP